VLDRAFQYFLVHKMPSKDLQAVLQQYLTEALEADLEQHRSTPYGRSVYTSLTDEHEDPIDADSELVQSLLSDAREALIRRDIASVADKVERLMGEHRLPPEVRLPLAYGVLQADIQILERMHGRVINGATAEIRFESSSSPSASRLPAISNRKLSDALPAFLELMSTEEGWRGQTLAQNRATYRMFLEHVGDRLVHCYTRQDCASFYDALRKLPAMYAKNPKWGGLTLAQIGEQTRDLKVDRLTMKTIKRHFSALGGLFDYLKRRGQYEGENPAHGFEFPQKGRASKKRQMWEGEKLRKLFASPVWSGCLSEARRSTPGSLVIKDDKYWLPLLGLYHGNRLEEFAQLRREDVRSDGGIWYFDINDEGGRQIKNEQSRRKVPLHPAILALGFINYVEGAAPKPDDMVFPELRPGGPDNKYGYYFTKWWSRYRREIGLYEKGLDYHSFRHGVTTKLFAADVSEAIVDELTGHEGKGTSRVVYKKEMPLKILNDAISKVQWVEVTLPRLP
jgi:integrase